MRGRPAVAAHNVRHTVGDDDAARGGHRPKQTPVFHTLREDGGWRRIILPYDLSAIGKALDVFQIVI